MAWKLLVHCLEEAFDDKGKSLDTELITRAGQLIRSFGEFPLTRHRDGPG